jgi:Histidine kinase-like ATPase domain
MTVLGIVTFCGSSAACSPRVAGLADGPVFRAHHELVSTRDWPLCSYLELQALPEAVSFARQHARRVLHEWRMAALAETVELLVSEIVTNAVRASGRPAPDQHGASQHGASQHGASQHGASQHGASQVPGALPLRFWLTSDRHRVMIQVWDRDHHQPIPQNADPEAETGRGLLLVEALSAQWGCYAPGGQGGKIVWVVCVP